MSSDGWYDTYELTLRLQAILSLLRDSEQNGLRISKDAQDAIEHECMFLFEHEDVPLDRVRFAALLKDTAVRLFRQRRYAEADVRYRMASLFDPRDITLVSNRATCMYNLKKYERCIDLCYACMMSFPTIIFKNTLFYMKLVVRIGQANIELNNYKEARKTYRSLAILKRHIELKCGIDVDDEQFQAIEMPFQRHLEAAIERYEARHPGKPIIDLSKRRTPYELGLDGFLHENFEVSMAMGAEEYVEDILHYEDESDAEGENDDEFDDNIAGTVELAHLCCHVWTQGTGPCRHIFPEEENVRKSGNRKKKRETDGSEVSTDQGTGEEEGGGSETDDDMPELISGESDFYESETEEDSSGSGERDKNTGERGVRNFETVGLNGRSEDVTFTDREADSNNELHSSIQCAHSCPASAHIEMLADSVRKKHESRAALEALREEIRARREKRFAPRQDFLQGFLNCTSDEPCGCREAQPEISITPPCGTAKPSDQKTSTHSVIAYETDEEDDPVSEMCSLAAVENAVTEAGKTIGLLPQDGSTHIKDLIRDVFGEKYSSATSVDSIDFVFLFGEHMIQVKPGKKKKRSCDRRCAACFARKMWKLRFTNRDVVVTSRYIDHLREDARLDRNTFLSEELWQSIGYYGSGHELTFGIPTLIHGVAYICLLQSEVKWRGDFFPLDDDIQFAFLSALDKNLTTSRLGVNTLFNLLFMLRDTVTLFDVLSDQKSRGLTPSFQFAKNASEIATSFQNTFGPKSGSTADRDAFLMTRHVDCLKNTSNWGSLGHVAREEVWVYKSLLRDVTGLLLNFTSRMTVSPRSAGLKETFSEAFRRLCGDRDDDEIQWKHRIISAISKQRCRVMERNSSSRKMADLSRSALLLSKVIDVRENQPRLYYKRADVYAHQRKWGECLRDLHTTRMLVGEQTTVKETMKLLDRAHRLLLLHTYSLEGEAYSALGRKPGKDQRKCVRLAFEFYSKALEVSPKSKRTKASLQKKLRALRSLEEEVEHHPVSADVCSEQPSSNSIVGDAQLAETSDERHTGHVEASEDYMSESSSEGEAQDKVAGNQYAPLLGNSAFSSHQPTSTTSGHPRNCDLCRVTFWSEADHSSHINGKRHKSMLGKARKQSTSPAANEPSSSPGTRLNPTRTEVVEHTRRIVAALGGQARLSDIIIRLNLRRWRIRDASSYIENTYGGLLSMCREHQDVLHIGAGSSADPVLSLRKVGSAVSDGSQRKHKNIRPAASGGTRSRGKARLSETADFSQMVTDLLNIESNKEAKIKSDEEECGICLDNEPDVRCWPCGHVWCDPCMKLYLAKKGTGKGVECPKCRGTIETLNRIAVD